MIDTEKLTFPSGRSVRNCRKDARRLVSERGIPLNQAQDEIAKMNGGKANWSLSIKHIRANAEANPKKIEAPKMTVRDAQIILKQYPFLTRFGIGVFSGGSKDSNGHSYGELLEIGQKELLDHIEECNRALLFLQHVEKRKSINRNVGTSYGLKHQATAFLRDLIDPPEETYISNGAFICAALFAGFEMKLNAEGGPNVTFNISSMSPVFKLRKLAVRRHYLTANSYKRIAELTSQLGVKKTLSY